MLKKSRIMRFQDAEKTIEGATNFRQKIFLKVLYYTGARISEIVGNDLEEKRDPLISNRIDDKNNIILLRNLKNRKVIKKCEACNRKLTNSQIVCVCGNEKIIEKFLPKRWKEVVVPDSLIKELVQYISIFNIKADKPIFNFTRRTGYNYVKNAALKMGITKIADQFPHPHHFRHAFVMKALDKGIDLRLIQEQTGHKNLAVLSEYLSLTKDKKSQIEKMFGK